MRVRTAWEQSTIADDCAHALQAKSIDEAAEQSTIQPVSQGAVHACPCSRTSPHP